MQKIKNNLKKLILIKFIQFYTNKLFNKKKLLSNKKDNDLLRELRNKDNSPKKVLRKKKVF